MTQAVPPTSRRHSAAFISLATSCKALTFGSFNLKSGRVSPYFFNAGNFSTGHALSELADCYADGIVAEFCRAHAEHSESISPHSSHSLPFDVLFGPAYKGIPLVAAVATSLYRRHGIDLPFVFNRKESKAHGEGGTLIGTGLSAGGQRVLVVDDVVTAGTAIREAIAMVEGASVSEGAKPNKVVAVFVGLDRDEKMSDTDGKSACMQVSENLGIEVKSVAKLGDLLAFCEGSGSLGAEVFESVNAYRLKWGVDRVH